MKTSTKKLALNKETVRNLDAGELARVGGGWVGAGAESFVAPRPRTYSCPEVKL